MKAIKIKKAMQVVKRRQSMERKDRTKYMHYVQILLQQKGYNNFRLKDYSKAHKFLTKKYGVAFGVERRADGFWLVIKSIPERHIENVELGVLNNRRNAMLNMLELMCENI